MRQVCVQVWFVRSLADTERAIALVLSLAPSAEILSGDQVEARANSRI